MLGLSSTFSTCTLKKIFTAKLRKWNSVSKKKNFFLAWTALFLNIKQGKCASNKANAFIFSNKTSFA